MVADRGRRCVQSLPLLSLSLADADSPVTVARPALGIASISSLAAARLALARPAYLVEYEAREAAEALAMQRILDGEDDEDDDLLNLSPALSSCSSASSSAPVTPPSPVAVPGPLSQAQAKALWAEMCERIEAEKRREEEAAAADDESDAASDESSLFEDDEDDAFDLSEPASWRSRQTWTLVGSLGKSFVVSLDVAALGAELQRRCGWQTPLEEDEDEDRD